MVQLLLEILQEENFNIVHKQHIILQNSNLRNVVKFNSNYLVMFILKVVDTALLQNCLKILLLYLLEKVVFKNYFFIKPKMDNFSYKKINQINYKL